MSEYLKYWEAPNMQAAWQKIVTADQENENETKATAEIILQDVPKGGAALEIGAGVGRLMKAVSAHFDSVQGADMSADMVTFSAEYLAGYPNCEVFLTDGKTLQWWENNSIDFVYSYITFQHMPDLEHVNSNISELYRVLRKGGIARVQTTKGVPAQEFSGMWGHYFETAQAFASLFKATGLTVTKAAEGISHPSTIWVTATK